MSGARTDTEKLRDATDDLRFAMARLLVTSLAWRLVRRIVERLVR